MEIINQLEYPLPILKIRTEKIVIEVSNSIESFLLVENAGSGTLSGKVMSNSHFLKFSQEDFSGNIVKLHYLVDCSGNKPGEIVHSDVVVASNGGEKIIPVVIKIIQAFISTSENIKLYTIKEFFTYAKKYPLQARQMFVSQDFMIWLMNIGYEYLDIFDHIKKDPNKERALENFFILNKLKNKPILTATEKTISVAVSPIFEKPIKKGIAIRKSGWGYAETDIRQKNPKDWFKLLTNRLTSNDFDDTDTAYLYYEIDSRLLKSKISKASLVLSEGIEIEILAKISPLLKAKTDKTTYGFDDKGFLIVHNNFSSDVTIDITLKDNYLKFEGKKYFVGEYAEIPFTVKLSALQIAQFAIKKVPVVTTELTIAANINMHTVKQTILLNLGNPILV